MGQTAISEYQRALSATHRALRDPDLATSDGVLAAVLLLSIFENISATKMGEFAWGSHVEGAIQLVKARGRKQLQTATGLRLFIAVRTQLVSGFSDSYTPQKGTRTNTDRNTDHP
jgi:hypothetical protein